jgi:hypothetical protein
MEEQNKSTQETLEQAEEREDRFVFIDMGSAELKAHLRKMADRKYTTITGVIKEWVRVDMEQTERRNQSPFYPETPERVADAFTMM